MDCGTVLSQDKGNQVIISKKINSNFDILVLLTLVFLKKQKKKSSCNAAITTKKWLNNDNIPYYLIGYLNHTNI